MQDAGEGPPLNSPQYWNARFLTDWAARGGQKQTAYFARLAVEMLPDWFKTAVRDARMSVYDYGCAFGDALPIWRAAFPEGEMRGGDVAPVAIAVAGAVHPAFGFELLSPDGRGEVLADVVYCSNTLEHFQDWRARLEGIARRSREFCVVLVPFREKEPREPEHVAAFDYDTLPLRLNNDFQLLHLATADVRRRESRFWSGEQLLAIYGKPREQGSSTAEGLRAVALDTSPGEWSADFRGVPDALSHLVLELRREGLDLVATKEVELKAALERAATGEKGLADALDRNASLERELEQAALQNTILKRNFEEAAAGQEHARTQILAQKAALERELAEVSANLNDAEARARAALESIDQLSKLGAKQTQEAAQLGVAIRRANEELAASKQEAAELGVTIRRANDELTVSKAETADTSSRLSTVQNRVRSFAVDASAPIAKTQAALRELENQANSAVQERNALIARLLNARSVRFARAIRSFFGQSIEFKSFGPVTFSVPDLSDVQTRVNAVVDEVGGAPRPQPDRVPEITTEPNPESNLPAVRFPAHPVVFQLDQFDKGGVEQVVFDMAWGFHTRGFPTTVISIGRIGQLGQELQSLGVSVMSCDGDEAKHGAIVAMLKPQAVFLNHSYLGVQNWKSSGVRIYDVVHNYYFWQEANRMRGVADDSRKIVAVSEAVASFHAEQFGISREKIVSISNPLHPQGFNRPSRDQLKRVRSGWQQEFTFINLAHFYPAKAHAALVSAFAEVHRKHPHTRLKILGAFTDGAVEGRVREIISRTGIGSAVSLMGHRSRRQVGFELATAHAFVLPSIYEGCSIALAEAAYYGLPVILTDVGSARTVIENEDCGILIPPATDLHKTSASDINQLGLAEAQSNQRVLVDAMMRMVEDYATWQARGYVGQDKVARRTLKSRVTAYCEVAGLPLD